MSAKPPSSGLSASVIAASLAVLLVFLGIWEWLPPLLKVPEFILPGPSKIWSEFQRMSSAERLWYHSGITALEVVVGFILGSLLGVLIGYVLGSFQLMAIINAVGLAFTLLLVVPDWPWFSRHPLEWLPPLKGDAAAAGAGSKKPVKR